ncbi:MAG: hypothetical protein Q8K68_07400, partial [Nitrospirota bacterium]|nr:hypothetical protein [Nitrospirota bacterium]
FHWKNSTGYDTVNSYTGFSAQNVQRAIPEAIDTDNRGHLTLSDRPILAASVNAIKELNLRTLYLASGSVGAVERNLAVTSNADIAGELTVARTGTFKGYVEASAFLVGNTSILPEEVLTSGRADLYKMGTYALTNIEFLAGRMDIFIDRMDSLEKRLLVLESENSAVSKEAPFSLSSLRIALSSVEAFIDMGIARFSTLVFRQIVVSADEEGNSSAGSITILAGNTVAEIENPYVQANSKIFITFTSPVRGSWYISRKEEGMFQITLESRQDNDTSFDYFVMQSEGENTQIASPMRVIPTPQPVPIVPPTVTPKPEETPITEPEDETEPTLPPSTEPDEQVSVSQTPPPEPVPEPKTAPEPEGHSY